MLDLSRYVFLYSQDLDNKGGTEYWRIDKESGHIDKLSENSNELIDIRLFIDDIARTGRAWFSNEYKSCFKLRFSGETIINIKPVTLDKSGRISPVLVLCDILNLESHNVEKIKHAIQRKLGRELSDDNLKGLRRLESYLKWPRWFLFLNVLFFSRRTG